MPETYGVACRNCLVGAVLPRSRTSLPDGGFFPDSLWPPDGRLEIGGAGGIRRAATGGLPRTAGTPGDLARLSCAQLDSLAKRSERIGDDAARLADNASPAVGSASACTAMQAYAQAQRYAEAMIRTGCP